MQKVYTTTQVSKICRVCARTVCNWVDSGMLKGYRVPGSKARRIPHNHLVKFLQAAGYPLGSLSAEQNILLISNSTDIEERIKQALKQSGHLAHCVLHRAKNAFEAGILMSSMEFGSFIVDTQTPGVEAIISRFLLDDTAHSKEVAVIAICHSGDRYRAPSEWAHDSFQTPYDPKLLCLRLQGLLSRFHVGA